MSTTVLVTLTVVEIVALVAVLALFVIALTSRLNSVATLLKHVSEGVLRAIQGDVFLVGAGAAILNGQLDAIAGALPAIVEKAETLPAQQSRAAQRSQPSIPRQSRTETSGAARQPSADHQDPMIRRS